MNQDDFRALLTKPFVNAPRASILPTRVKKSDLLPPRVVNVKKDIPTIKKNETARKTETRNDDPRGQKKEKRPVSGLDYALLSRIKAGEDVLGEITKQPSSGHIEDVIHNHDDSSAKRKIESIPRERKEAHMESIASQERKKARVEVEYDLDADIFGDAGTYSFDDVVAETAPHIEAGTYFPPPSEEPKQILPRTPSEFIKANKATLSAAAKLPQRESYTDEEESDSD